MRLHKLDIIILFIFLIFYIPNGIIAQQDSLQQRPKIGLVLSGGGAKGVAEIASLRLIEKYNIPIDYITGTSIGSVIGALYSMGYSADDIENISRNMKWDEMFTGETKRELISIEEKDEEGKYVLEVPVKKGKPVIATGLISGQKIEMELAKITWSAHNVRDFSKLPIPFACVATDIVKGEAVYFTGGYLPNAIRASMSIPSVLSAFEIDGKLLVDGGLTNNFPVSYAKKMGADIIIGVNVSSNLYTKDELNSMVKIMDQAASFANAKLTKEEIKKVDILVSPNIDGFSALSFDAASIDTLIQRGNKAAQEKEHLFAELSEKLKKYKFKRKPIIPPSNLYSIFIHKIKYEGLKKVSKTLIKSKLQLKDSSWVTLKDIERGVEMVYGSKYFEKVNYRIEQKNNRTNLIIKVIEQPFSIYKIGVNYNNYFNSSLILNGTFHNILGEGSRLLLSAKLGVQPEFSFNYSIFTTLKPSIGFVANAKFYNIEETYYNFTNSTNLRVNSDVVEGKIGLESTISNSTLIGVGTKISYKNVESQDLAVALKKPYRSALSAYGYLNIDTYDKNMYPNNGIYLKLAGSYVVGELNKTDNFYDKKYWKMFIDYNQYFPITKKFNYKHYFVSAISLKENLFFSDRYFLGGVINFKDYIFPLEGFKFMEIMGHNVAVAGGSIRYEPWHSKFVFATVNAGIAENKISDLIKPNEIYFGGALGFGMRTIIGPIEYRISINSHNHQVNHWLQIGYLF